jgi:Arc/MetJ-type ribon-helix-helix transcriptional regulator
MSENKEDERASIVSTYHEKRWTTSVNVRIPQALIDKLDHWVENDHFKSRSDFIVTAVRRYLEDLDEMEQKKTETSMQIGSTIK